jgi:hypothetical protein
MDFGKKAVAFSAAADAVKLVREGGRRMFER